jgi:hypothetical protein
MKPQIHFIVPALIALYLVFTGENRDGSITPFDMKLIYSALNFLLFAAPYGFWLLITSQGKYYPSTMHLGFLIAHSAIIYTATSTGNWYLYPLILMAGFSLSSVINSIMRKKRNA